jgi:hypothetical protein
VADVTHSEISSQRHTQRFANFLLLSIMDTST